MYHVHISHGKNVIKTKADDKSNKKFWIKVIKSNKNQSGGTFLIFCNTYLFKGLHVEISSERLFN